MNQRINLNRKVYNKSDYLKTIDTSFNELLTPIPLVEEDSITKEKFFYYYYYIIF